MLLFHPLLVYLFAFDRFHYFERFIVVWLIFDFILIFNLFFSLVMISHLYDFSNFKILFTFFYESFKDLIFQLLGISFLSFHFCHKWFDFPVFPLLFDLFFVVDMVTQFLLFFKTECCTNWIISIRAKQKFKQLCTNCSWQVRMIFDILNMLGGL